MAGLGRSGDGGRGGGKPHGSARRGVAARVTWLSEIEGALLAATSWWKRVGDGEFDEPGREDGPVPGVRPSADLRPEPASGARKARAAQSEKRPTVLSESNPGADTMPPICRLLGLRICKVLDNAGAAPWFRQSAQNVNDRHWA